MSLETEDLLRELSANAESVCRHYLPAGRREGSYWVVGDLQNSPGRSLFVRLVGPTSGPGAAGKYTDAATGDHGDLLDIIRERTGITRFSGTSWPSGTGCPGCAIPEKAETPRQNTRSRRALVCSLGAGRRQSCRDLSPEPGHRHAGRKHGPALSPEVLASG
jgi:hypothetical protein